MQRCACSQPPTAAHPSARTPAGPQPAASRVHPVPLAEPGTPGAGTPTPQGDPQPGPGEETWRVGAQGACPASCLATLLFSENRLGSDPPAWHQLRKHRSHDLAEIGLTV